MTAHPARTPAAHPTHRGPAMDPALAHRRAGCAEVTPGFKAGARPGNAMSPGDTVRQGDAVRQGDVVRQGDAVRPDNAVRQGDAMSPGNAVSPSATSPGDVMARPVIFPPGARA